MKSGSERFSLRTYALFTLALLSAMLLCICVGSVSIPLRDTVRVILGSMWGLEAPEGVAKAIIWNVRLPRVINVALVGAALSFGSKAVSRRFPEEKQPVARAAFQISGLVLAIIGFIIAIY